MSKFEDHSYLQGYADAMKEVSEQMDAYKDFAFEDETFSEEQVEGVNRMEHDMQGWLLDKAAEIEDEVN